MASRWLTGHIVAVTSHVLLYTVQRPHSTRRCQCQRGSVQRPLNGGLTHALSSRHGGSKCKRGQPVRHPLSKRLSERLSPLNVTH